MAVCVCFLVCDFYACANLIFLMFVLAPSNLCLLVLIECQLTEKIVFLDRILFMKTVLVKLRNDTKELGRIQERCLEFILGMCATTPNNSSNIIDSW